MFAGFDFPEQRETVFVPEICIALGLTMSIGRVASCEPLPTPSQPDQPHAYPTRPKAHPATTPLATVSSGPESALTLMLFLATCRADAVTSCDE